MENGQPGSDLCINLHLSELCLFMKPLSVCVMLQRRGEGGRKSGRSRPAGMVRRPTWRLSRAFFDKLLFGGVPTYPTFRNQDPLG